MYVCKQNLTLYAMSKNCANLFLPELCQISTIFDIFYRKMAKRLKLCEEHSFPTSPHLIRFTTLPC